MSEAVQIALIGVLGIALAGIFKVVGLLLSMRKTVEAQAAQLVEIRITTKEVKGVAEEAKRHADILQDDATRLQDIVCSTDTFEAAKLQLMARRRASGFGELDP